MILEFFPYPLLAGLGILAILLFLLHRKRRLSYLFCFAIFWAYLLLVVSVTLFPIPMPEALGSRSPAAYILSHANLVPFYFGQLFDSSSGVIFQEIIGNLLLLLPFGFGIRFLVGFETKHILWLAIGAGLAIEMAQLGFNLVMGVVYRSVDINDVILNASGALLGYAIFRVFARLRGAAFVDLAAR